MGVGLGGRGLSGSLPTDCKCLSQDPLSLPEGPKLPVVTRCGQLKTCPHPLPPPCSPTAPAQGVAFQACHSHQKTYQKPPLLLKQVRVLWKSAFKNSVCVVFLKNTCCAFSSLIFFLTIGRHALKNPARKEGNRAPAGPSVQGWRWRRVGVMGLRPQCSSRRSR